MKTRSYIPSLILFILICSLFFSACSVSKATQVSSSPSPESSLAIDEPKSFDASRAYQDVLNQENLGPRIPESEAHSQVIEYIRSELEKCGWQVEIQSQIYMGHPVENIVARRADSSQPIILGAHYDSRMAADQDEDPELQTQPVSGANDGASGVAVLLEIARVLPETNQNVWLVFFDAEDQGDLPSWNWILGSSVFAQSLSVTPKAVVVIDMIGDANLNIYQEKSSDQELRTEIWQTAKDLGYSDQFIDQEKYSMIDDHTPFLTLGYRAIDIIDFDYPYWHTSQDTADKVSPISLEIVGTTLLTWLAE